MSVLKTKLNNKVKIASDKTENKQNNLYFSKKMVIHQFIIRLGNNETKKNRNFKVRKFAELKKKISFKVMKTIRNQLNYPIGL